MTKAREGNDSPDQREHPPHRVRLPGFITDEEIELGEGAFPFCWFFVRAR